jgi:putative pyoverdin transport system ATP-binding/permease protein
MMNSEFTSKIDSLAQASMVDGLVPGMAVVVVQGGKIVFTKGYGYADLKQQLPFTERTSIQIGSTSKNMTGFAIAQLVERGLLELDDSVTKYLPYFKVAHPKSNDITVRYLLAQTSGLPTTDWVYEHTIVNAEVNVLETLVRSLATVKLHHAPGESYEYSNYNYAVLGLLIQSISGMSYEDYMTENVFAPLGMTRTFAPKTTTPMTELDGLEPSCGYLPGSKTPNLERAIVTACQWNSSGMIVSNAEDVGKYLLAQLNGGHSVTGKQVIGAEALELSHQGLAEGDSTLGGSMRYAFGWETAQREGVRVIEHGGDARTSATYFLLLPDQGIGVAILLNLVDYGKVQLTYQIAKTMLGLEIEPYQPLAKTEAIPTSTFKSDITLWQNYLGEYDTVRGKLEVFSENTVLNKNTVLKMRLAKGSSVEEAVTLEAQTNASFVTRSEALAFEGIAFSFEVKPEGRYLLYEDERSSRL